MKTIAIHSHKGGVGKTTVALLLAKWAAASRRVCLVDCDFIGTGITGLLSMRAPSRYLEDFLLDDDPYNFPVSSLLGSYSDKDLGADGFSVVLNRAEGALTPRAAKRRLEVRQAMMGLVATEENYGEIETRTQILLDLLKRDNFDIVICDCHPGMVFVSRTIIPLAALNLYVATPNRSDCFGLLKEINLRNLDKPNAFLLINRSALPGNDLKSFRSAMERDEVVGGEAAGFLPQLKHAGHDESRTFLVPETDELRSLFHIGGAALLPSLRAGRGEFGFCQKILSAL
jgi:cellulose biosynthesis protein BcsQ